MKSTLTVAEMRRAHERRDPAYNGLFVVGVRTTGIFCRPICPARMPLAKNVEYFPDNRAALVAGYRPCKRCRPLDENNQPAWVVDLLQTIEKNPSVRIRERDLRARGVDPATVRRYFLKHFNMTFQAFARARRLTTAMNGIREGRAIDEAAFDSGYDSLSGFRDAFAKVFGNSPGASRNGECIHLAWIRSPLGPLVAGANSAGLCLLEFTDRRMLEAQLKTVARRFEAPMAPGSNKHLDRLKEELAAYFAGKLQRFTVPLIYPGSPFQQRVWAELLKIPYGETRSYQDMAIAVSSPKAVRAVGRANGMNRIGIVIPCHRVVNKDGKLGGYGGGLRRKQFLLDLEREHKESKD
jgi:AraC family transcriptional regulator of adaptative response/methylated-DNA-[protein]-cysteine methyltransferase